MQITFKFELHWSNCQLRKIFTEFCVRNNGGKLCFDHKLHNYSLANDNHSLSSMI